MPSKKKADPKTTKKNSTPTAKKASTAKNSKEKTSHPTKKATPEKATTTKKSTKTTKVASKSTKKETPIKSLTSKASIAKNKISEPKSKKASEKSEKTTKAPEKMTVKSAPKQEKPKETQQKIPDNKTGAIELKPKKQNNKFKKGEYAVYPSHGIGKIIDVESTVVMNRDFSCYLMYFEKERLTIKVPVRNSEKIGLRPLVSKETMDEVFDILKSGIKKMKGMWSRRAQEYETKINSGDIMALAEVLRDLARDVEDGERSYSERIIYETAVARLAAEYGAIHQLDFETAKQAVIETAKDKSAEELIVKAPKHDDFDDEFDDIEEDDEGDFEDDENDFEEEEENQSSR